MTGAFAARLPGAGLRLRHQYGDASRYRTDLHPGRGMMGRLRTDAPGQRPQCALCRYRRHSIMTVSRQVCPFHGDEDIQGVPTGAGEDSLTFTCTRSRGHPQQGQHSWLHVPQPDGLAGLDGYAAELRLATELLVAIAEYQGKWIEYGVERAYALRCPDDFATVVSRYGHTAVKAKQYIASAFLAGVLGVLSKQGAVLYHLGPATGRWKYNGTISW